MKYKFTLACNAFIYRSPLKSLTDLYKLNAKISFSTDYESVIVDYFDSIENEEALSLASPSLYTEYNSLKRKEYKSETKREKAIQSLYKYILRSHSRCTPFGMFSGVGQGAISDSDNFLKPFFIDTDIKLRYDNEFVSWLANGIRKDVKLRTTLKYYVNPTYYILEREVKYYDFDNSNNRRTYYLTKISLNDCLSYILEILNEPQPYDYITSQILSRFDYPVEEVIGYINDLISSNFLIDEFFPNVIGEQYFGRLKRRCEEIEFNNPNTIVLRALENIISSKDSINKKLANVRECTEFTGKDIFQVDLISVDKSNKLNRNFIESVLENINTIKYFLVKKKDFSSIETFVSRFLKKFGNMEIPLNIAIDPVAGVDFGDMAHDIKRSLIDFVPPARSQQPSGNGQYIFWKPLDDIILKKLTNLRSNPDSVIRLTNEDFPINMDQDDGVAKSSFLFGTVFSEDNKSKFHLGFIDGPPSTKLFGRFCYDNDTLTQIARGLHQEEQSNDKNCIFVELVYVSQDRASNILFRPELRDFELQILGTSQGEKAKVLPLNDILVSVRGSTVILTSRSLKSRIIPRESTAFSPSFNNIPVYVFLIYVQLQESRNMIIYEESEHLAKLQYLPRIEYENIVISPARWKINYSDIEDLMEVVPSLHILKMFCQRFNLPETVRINSGDGKLTVQLNNVLSLIIIFNSIRKHKLITLEEEMILSQKNQTDTAAIKDFRNEVVVPLKCYNKPQYEIPELQQSNSPEDIKLLPGSNYLYFKFYLKSQHSNFLIKELIADWVEKLNEYNLIEGFFYIKYIDYSFHIRIRFYSRNMTNSMGSICSILDNLIKKFYDNQLLEDYYIAPYEQELSMYSPHMNLAESLFFVDSEFSVKIIKEYDKEMEQDFFLLNVLIHGISDIFSLFEISESKTIKLMEMLSNGFVKEFGDTKELKVVLDLKFREYTNRKDFTKIPTHLSSFLINRYKEMEHILSSYQKEKPLSDNYKELLVGRLIHLYVNRICKRESRKHELIVYYILKKYYVGKNKQKLPFLKS